MLCQKYKLNLLVECNRTGRKASVAWLWSTTEGEDDSVLTDDAVTHPSLFP